MGTANNGRLSPDRRMGTLAGFRRQGHSLAGGGTFESNSRYETALVTVDDRFKSVSISTEGGSRNLLKKIG